MSNLENTFTFIICLFVILLFFVGSFQVMENQRMLEMRLESLELQIAGSNKFIGTNTKLLNDLRWRSKPYGDTLDELLVRVHDIDGKGDYLDSHRREVFRPTATSK